ncbi:MAG: hypothetical protein ACRERD_12135 [Candidatus Binatia bacterium]
MKTISMRRLGIVLVAAVSCWGVGGDLYAAGDIFERVSLRGLTAVQVVVEDLAPDIAQDGLNREHLKAAVEQQLQRAAIAVEPQAEHALYIHLGTAKNEDGSYSYGLSLQLLQLVLLLRNPGLVTWGATWSIDQVGSVTPANVSTIESLITRGVNAFIKDYQAANPTG